MIVVPSADSARISSHDARRAAGSSPVVGSSRNSSSGCPMMPSARSTRRRCPPESFSMRWSTKAPRPTSSTHSSERARAGVARRVHRQHLADGEDPLDPRRLQHDADAVVERPVGPARVDAEHRDLAGGGVPVALEDLDRRRLAGPVLAEQAVHLAGTDVERQPVDGGDLGVALDETADLDERSGPLEGDPPRQAPRPRGSRGGRCRCAGARRSA